MIILGLILKGGEASRLGGSAGTGPNGPSLIVQGSRTAVHVGGGNAAGPAAAGKVTPPGPTPPGIDIDRVAAMMTSERGRSTILSIIIIHCYELPILDALKHPPPAF